jgi:hypothetical protein
VDLVGSVSTFTTGPTLQDTNNYALTVLACAVAPCGDNVTINATVPPIFEFALSTNTMTFSGNLDYTVVNTSSHVDATVTTNAKGGWIMWAKSQNLGLSSTSSGGTIPTVSWNSDLPTTLSPGSGGTAQDALGVTTLPATTPHVNYCSTSNLTVDPEYDTVGHAGTHGGAYTANYAEIGTCTGAVSDNDGLRMVCNVAITPVTPAATDYTDIVTVVGAGNF